MPLGAGSLSILEAVPPVLIAPTETSQDRSPRASFPTLVGMALLQQDELLPSRAWHPSPPQLGHCCVRLHVKMWAQGQADLLVGSKGIKPF